MEVCSRVGDVRKRSHRSAIFFLAIRLLPIGNRVPTNELVWNRPVGSLYRSPQRIGYWIVCKCLDTHRNVYLPNSGLWIIIFQLAGLRFISLAGHILFTLQPHLRSWQRPAKAESSQWCCQSLIRTAWDHGFNSWQFPAIADARNVPLLLFHERIDEVSLPVIHPTTLISLHIYHIQAIYNEKIRWANFSLYFALIQVCNRLYMIISLI